ncbi:MAG: DHHW family protein [Niameybacter sp.]|uniref:DHHW family protein n=1 Tax=Niameybacter sp. TaxID=2033640 RepID=UPI002FCA14CF
MRRSFQIVMTLSFVTYIGGFFALQLITKDKTFSELENRTLATKPKFTTQKFFDGTYGREVETYIADQFPVRDEFIAIKSNTERLLQKKENNGVYIGKDDYFLQKFETPDLELMKKNIDYINKFGENFNLYFMLAPTATKVYEDKLPNYATPYDEKFFIDTVVNGLNDKIHKVDVLDKLEAHEAEDLYYKTDHHWSTLGAYYGYTAFCEAYGIEPLPMEDFDRVIGSDAFYGSLFSKGNFTFARPDTVELFVPKDPEKLEVFYMADNKTTDTVYEMEQLEKKDKYTVFLGGNHPIITIKSDVNNGKKLAVIKDSYANAMIPFLTEQFEEIHVLDLRFLNMPIGTYMRENGIEDALMLYNVQNFAVVNQLSLLGK